MYNLKSAAKTTLQKLVDTAQNLYGQRRITPWDSAYNPKWVA